jgi:hypothetical protein
MMLPTWSVYCSNTTSTNALCFDLGRLTVWFSYKTPVAFRPNVGPRQPLLVRENDWGSTTGKHLNAIDGGDKKSRIPGEKFEELLKALLEE